MLRSTRTCSELSSSTLSEEYCNRAGVLLIHDAAGETKQGSKRQQISGFHGFSTWSVRDLGCACSS